MRMLSVTLIGIMVTVVVGIKACGIDTEKCEQVDRIDGSRDVKDRELV